MSVASAIRERDPAQLPGKRDEAWRWTDLRGLIRELPAGATPFSGVLEPGPFDGVTDDRRVIVNGGSARIAVPAQGQAIVELRIVTLGEGAQTSDVAVTVAKGATLYLLESYESDAASLAQTSLAFDLAENASVERVVLAQDAADAVNISQATVRLGGGAAFVQTVLTSGGRRQRIETHVSHPGRGGYVRLDGAYLLGERAHADQTTVVIHEGPCGRTEQLTKGVVRDQARGVFQGRIVVNEGADGTDAKMGHHALILSDRAEVDAKPELEIYADDVSCAHGNTVGALDENALFYAQQRGIAETEARAMLTEAFIGEVIDRIPHLEAREIARAWAAERLRV